MTFGSHKQGLPAPKVSRPRSPPARLRLPAKD